MIKSARVPGVLRERVRYTPYGESRTFPAEDVNRNGGVTPSDMSSVLSNFGDTFDNPGYNVGADINSDGIGTAADQSAVLTVFGDQIPADALSGEGKIIGYSGYLIEPDAHQPAF